MFMLMLEYFAAACGLFLFYTQVIEPFFRQRPYFPAFRAKPVTPPLDVETELALRKRIRDLEEAAANKQEDKL